MKTALLVVIGAVASMIFAYGILYVVVSPSPFLYGQYLLTQVLSKDVALAEQVCGSYEIRIHEQDMAERGNLASFNPRPPQLRTEVVIEGYKEGVKRFDTKDGKHGIRQSYPDGELAASVPIDEDAFRKTQRPFNETYPHASNILGFKYLSEESVEDIEAYAACYKEGEDKFNAAMSRDLIFKEPISGAVKTLREYQ